MLTSGLAYKNLSSVHNSISMHNSVIVVFTGSYSIIIITDQYYSFFFYFLYYYWVV